MNELEGLILETAPEMALKVHIALVSLAIVLWVDHISASLAGLGYRLPGVAMGTNGRLWGAPAHIG